MVHYGYINDKEYFGKWFNIGNHEKIKELSYTVIEEGICLPHRTTDSGKCGGGIVDDDKYIESSSLHFGFGVAYDYKKESVKYTAETVIYLGMFLGTLLN
jgi:hypothetical protein